VSNKVNTTGSHRRKCLSGSRQLAQHHALLLHGVFERHPNATILCFGHGVPMDVNFEMMKALKFDLPRFKIMKALRNTVCKIDSKSTLIVTRHNDHHSKKQLDHNFWLLDSMRLRLDIPEAPSDSLFLSQKGCRRGIEREDELFEALKVSNPSLRRILPDDFTVAQQAELFAHAKLIVAPHGASLTNVAFSNWNELVLIELSPGNPGHASFRNDLQVKRHCLLKCQSVPCKVASPVGNQCNVWERQIDVNVAQVTQVVNSILSGGHPDREDFVVRRHADL
jgi:capsular polysaccharide biosynthesis protein